MLGLGHIVLGLASVIVCLSGLGCQSTGSGPFDAALANLTDGGPADVAQDRSPCEAIAQTCISAQKACVIGEDDALSCESCPKGAYPAPPYATCAPIEGEAIEHEFAAITLAPGEEISSVCQTWILNNAEELWIHAVEFENDGGYHHSNWVFVPEGFNGWPTEPWYDCYANGFNEGAAGLMGGVLYAQSTQAFSELQKFKEGAALRIPPYSQIMAPTHLLNYNPVALTTSARLTLYAVPVGEVEIKLTPIVLTNRALALPKKSSSEFRSSCDFDDSFKTFLGGPLEAKLHYALPHYHDRAVGFRLAVYGGDRDGEVIFEDEGYGLEPFGRLFDPPIDLAGSKGLTFSCFYENESNKKIKWGIGDREMCDMLGFVESKASLIGYINGGELTKLEDGVYLHDGECLASTVEFSQSKEGGDPPAQ